MYDVDCECGNDDCSNSIMVRKGSIWFEGEEYKNWMHLDATDFKGSNVEIIVSPKQAKKVAWQIFKVFILKMDGKIARIKFHSRNIFWRH